MPEPVIAGRKSIKLEMEPGTVYWCACGRSEKQPFCDGSHAGTGFRPVAVEITEPQMIAFCACKHSKMGHICDHTHRTLPE